MFNYVKIGVEDFFVDIRSFSNWDHPLKMGKKQIIWRNYKLGANMISNINKQHKGFQTESEGCFTKHGYLL